MLKEKLKKIYFKITGKFKQKKFIHKNFTIISNNCFGGVVYRNNALPYNTPTAGLFFMADDYIKFVYNLKEYLDKELVEIKLQDSKYIDYLNRIDYNAPIGKLGDIEIMFLHYPTFEEAKEKWDRRKKRINYDKIIYKFSEQNECTYEHLKKFNELKVNNKICFTRNKYPKLNTIQFTEFEDINKEFLDSKEKIYKKYFNVYDYINNIKLSSNKIKILALTANLDKCNGISSYIMNYYYKLDKSKFQMDFIVTGDEVCEEYKNDIEANGSKIYMNGAPKLKSFINDLNFIKNFMREHNDYDIIHSHLVNLGYFYLKYAKKAGIKTRIEHSHTIIQREKNKIRDYRNQLFKNLVVKHANVYFACSKVAGEDLFKKNKFHIIQNAISADDFVFNEKIRKEYRKLLGINKKIVIGHVGRFDYVKNQGFIVDILKKLVEIDPSYYLIFIGDGVNKLVIENQVKTLGLSNNVRFLGIRSDVNKLLQAMDIFVLPSLYEGLPVVAVEAQFNGLTCLLSNNITNETKIIDNLKFLTLDVEEWTSEILKLSSKINRSNKIETKKFNIDYETKKLQQKYCNLIKNHNNDKKIK